MTVRLAAPAYGLAVGADYTGPEEDWLLHNGYAYVLNEKATLTGTSNAVNIVTGGNLVLNVDGTEVTTALATADTPAQAAGKVEAALDTALGAGTYASIVSSKLQVLSKTGSNTSTRTIKVVSGTGTVLANLGLAAGQTATTEKRNISGSLPANDPTLASNREDPGDAYQFGVGTGLAPRLEAVRTVNPDLSAKALPAAGGTALVVKGDNFTAATGVTFGATAGTAFSVVDDKTINVTSPAKAAGAYAVVVTKGVGNSNSLAAGVTYV